MEQIFAVFNGIRTMLPSTEAYFKGCIESAEYASKEIIFEKGSQG